MAPLTKSWTDKSMAMAAKSAPAVVDRTLETSHRRHPPRDIIFGN
jgi:hypothetical protein